ncbi:MAG: hypothetical protein RJB26_233 [Pseudomonadota bacterium]
MSRRLIALCGLAALADGYDVQVLGLAVPGMAQAMHVVPAAFTGVFTASLTGMACGAVGLAPLADRYGLRRLLLALLTLISIATAGSLLVRTPQGLAIWRFFAGLGLGALVPVVIALAVRHADPAKRNFQVTLMVTCTALGSFLAGMVAPMVESRWQWQGLFGLGALLPLPILFLVATGLPQDTPAEASEVRRPSLSGVDSLFKPELRRRTIVLWTLFWVSLFAIYALISWLPSLLTAAGWERAAAQRAAGFMALGSVMGGPLLASLVDRGHGRWAPAVAYAVAALALVPFVTGSVPAAWIVPVLVLIGACAMGSQQALGAFSALHYPEGLRATGTGWASGIGRFGGMVGPAVLGMLLAHGTAPGYVLGVLALPLLLAAVAVILLPALPARN